MRAEKIATSIYSSSSPAALKPQLRDRILNEAMVAA
jgi:hypothetical protein